MLGALEFDVDELADRRFSEPRELLERDEDLPTLDQQPESVRRDVRYLNLRSGLSMQRGSRSRAHQFETRLQKLHVARHLTRLQHLMV